jgi:glycosyltransferase involved in cell wall biosynthesis
MDEQPELGFAKYFISEQFVDRFSQDTQEPIDVLIPVMNTNELWRKNLFSIFREIPVRRLLIGDGGSIDNTIQIVSQFPRVKVIDQRNRKSLGYCIRELTELVETEWFVYLHSDVYLPDGWFDAMLKHQSSLDWFECNRRKTVLLDYIDHWQNAAERPFSGSQMGRKKIFDRFLHQIEDDYLYRNEDLVLRDLVENAGGRYGRVLEIFHYHQIMNKPGKQEPDFVRIELTRDQDIDWIVRTYNMQVRGIIKYTQPSKKYLINSVRASLNILDQYNALNVKEFYDWTAKTNLSWLPHIRGTTGKFRIIQMEIKSILQSLANIIRAIRPTPPQSLQTGKRISDE